MKTDIQEHYDSIQFKKALQELHITNVSELKEYNCVTLANKLRTGYNKLMIIRKLNDLGYLPSTENAISIHDIPMSRKMRNIFLRNGIVYLAQLSAYPREEILQFRNAGQTHECLFSLLCFIVKYYKLNNNNVTVQTNVCTCGYPTADVGETYRSRKRTT